VSVAHVGILPIRVVENDVSRELRFVPFRKPTSRLGDAQVLDALRPVRDPWFRRGLGELGLVRDVDVRGPSVRCTVAVPVAGGDGGGDGSGDASGADIEALRDGIRAALGGLEGVERVEVRVVPMTDAERAELAGRLPVTAVGDPASRTRVLGISSGKGGVGKSSITVNLAVALAQAGHDVAVLDADVYGFSVPKMLGIASPPLVVDRLIVPPVAHGVKCISMGFFAEDDQPVIWRGPMLHKALEQFLTDVYWGEPEFLLVDMPPGTGDVALSMAQFTPRSEMFVVTTPQPAAQRVAQRSALMAEKVHLEIKGVIENMSWFTGDDGRRYDLFGAGGGRLLAERLGVPLIGQVPLVPALREGGDVGRPVLVTDPDGEVAAAFHAIVGWLREHGPKRIYRSELTVR
jgi:ATP-binding protein involved in chromosome partitioning